MTGKRFVYILALFAALCFSIYVQAQNDDIPSRSNPARSNTAYDSKGRPIKKDTANDRLQHRDAFADSITINYHYFDSGRNYLIDSSINDFFTRYPVPNHYTDLGNFGNAARPFIFTPFMRAGWDAGFHAYDVYRFTPENTKLYNTSRPYTEFAYLLGSKSEQMISLLHTQNRRSNVNFGFEYRLMNAPGAFKNQNTNHNNIRINLSYTGKYKRYSNTLIYISNKLRSSENGGVQDDNSLTGLTFNDPFVVPVRMGNASTFSRNFFNTTIYTGSLYDQTTVLFRQNYDLGQKDSLVQDTITYRIFYPRIRFQYTIEYKKEKYLFKDEFPVDSFYLKYYNFIPTTGKIDMQDTWDKLTNDFSIISFPDKKNLNQFLKLGTGYEIISGGYDPYRTKYNNIYFAAEYRNRTRNKKWDVVAGGRLYGAGDYAGDYEALFSLERELKNNGYLQIGFQNVNRSPSSIYTRGVSAFPVISTSNFGKQNLSKAFGTVSFPKIQLELTGNYYIISNYIYGSDFFKYQQESTLFNVLHLGAEKKLQLSRHWFWYIELHTQNVTGNAPVNLPLLFTKNRFAFEGNFFRNLVLSTGFEVRYYTPYSADNYSPMTGQFFYQDTFSTENNRPDVNVFLNFRIKSFKGFLRLENLNAFNPDDQYRFTRYNFSGPHYPQRPLWFRLGIWWNFVN